MKVQLPSDGVNAEGATAEGGVAGAAGGGAEAGAEAGAKPEAAADGTRTVEGGGGLCEAEIQAVFSDVAALSAANGIAPWPEKSGDWDLKPEELPPPGASFDCFATVVRLFVRLIWAHFDQRRSSRAEFGPRMPMAAASPRWSSTRGSGSY